MSSGRVHVNRHGSVQIDSGGALRTPLPVHVSPPAPAPVRSPVRTAPLASAYSKASPTLVSRVPQSLVRTSASPEGVLRVTPAFRAHVQTRVAPDGSTLVDYQQEVDGVTVPTVRPNRSAPLELEQTVDRRHQRLAIAGSSIMSFVFGGLADQKPGVSDLNRFNVYADGRMIQTAPHPHNDKCADHYCKRTLHEGDAWLEVLRKHMHAGSKFEDAAFEHGANTIGAVPAAVALANRPAAASKLAFAQLQTANVEWERVVERNKKKCYLWFKFIDDDASMGEDRGKCYGFEAGLKLESDVTARIPETKNDADKWGPAPAFIRRAEEITRRALAGEDLSAFVWGDGVSFVANHVRSDVERFPLKFRGVGTNHRVCRNIKTPETAPLGHARIVVALELEFSADVFMFEEGMTEDGRVITPGDIRGGRAKNQSFSSALTILSCDDHLLYDIMPDVPTALRRTGEGDQQEFNDQGVYAFRFFRDGEWRIVVVDDYLAIDSDSKQLIFAAPPHRNFELYSVLAEKAFAKLNGSYKLTEGGSVESALSDLAGCVPFHYRIGPTLDGQYGGGSAGRERLWNDMCALRAESSLVGCSWSTAASTGNSVAQFSGVYGDTAYGVVALHYCTLVSGETERLVRIRSPRGYAGAYAGAWRAGGPEWLDVTVAEKERIGYCGGMDSTFFMSLEDFFNLWTSLHVGRMLMPTPYRQSTWTQYNVVGEFGADNEGFGSGSIAHCSQFQLKVAEDCEVVVTIDLSDRRVIEHVAAQQGEVAPLYGEAGRATADYPGIALPILKSARDENPIGQIYEGMLVQDGPVFMSQERWHSVQYKLRKEDGAFNITPATHRKYVGPYYLRVFTSKPSTLMPIVPLALA